MRFTLRDRRALPAARTLLALATASLAGLAVVVACGGDDSGQPPANASDATTGGPPIDVVGPAQEGGAVSSAMRLAHFAPALGSIDFCYRKPDQTKLTGPVLATPPAAKDGGEAGTDDDASLDASGDGAAEAAAPTTGPLAPFSVTSYVQIEGSGTFEIVIVRGDAASCAQPLATGKVTLDAGHLVTFTLVDGASDADAATLDGGPLDAADDGGAADADAGAGLAPARFLGFSDDPSIDPTRARIRTIHLALGGAGAPLLGPLRVTAVSGPNPVVAPLVEPGKAGRSSGAEPPVDALGYALVTPIAPLTALRVDELADAGAKSFTTVFADLGLGGASLHTAFVAGDATGPLVVLCSDKTTIGRRMACTKLSPER